MSQSINPTNWDRLSIVVRHAKSESTRDSRPKSWDFSDFSASTSIPTKPLAIHPQQISQFAGPKDPQDYGMNILVAIQLLVFSQISPSPMVMPVDSPQIINHYRAPKDKYSAGHRGIDLASQLGAAVYYPVAGTIAFSGKVGYRNLITIEWQDKTISLEPVCSELRSGTPVQAGEAVGTLCEADAEYRWHCEQCLHFGIKTESGYLSPEFFFGSLSPSRLLP